MSYSPPSTSDLVARNLANIEGRLNQTTPAADKAFNKVLSVIEAESDKGLYAYLADRVKANSALTAEGDDLDAIGLEYGVERDAPVACEVQAHLSADDGTEIQLNTVFVGPQGLLYDVKATITAPTSGTSGTGVSMALVCETAGAAGTLAVGDELTIQSPVSGAGRIATVTAVAVAGSDEEEDDGFRLTVLDAERAEPGGGNSSDFRSWAEAVANVKRAYPFSGVPYTSSVTAYPGMRTVYVEAAESYNSDGIADSTLLALVKAALLNDPDTGESRQILGLTEDTLYVQSIARTPIYVKVVGLAVTTGTLAAAQTAVTSALTTFLKQFRPFVDGLDPSFDRMDTLTSSILAREVQEVLDSYGGTCQNILFGTVLGTWLGTYSLDDGEEFKLGSVTFEAAS